MLRNRCLHLFSESCMGRLIPPQHQKQGEIPSLALSKVKQIWLTVLKEILMLNVLYLVCFIHTQTEI